MSPKLLQGTNRLPKLLPFPFAFRFTVVGKTLLPAMSTIQSTANYACRFIAIGLYADAGRKLKAYCCTQSVLCTLFSCLVNMFGK